MITRNEVYAVITRKMLKALTGFEVTIVKTLLKDNWWVVYYYERRRETFYNTGERKTLLK